MCSRQSQTGTTLLRTASQHTNGLVTSDVALGFLEGKLVYLVSHPFRTVLVLGINVAAQDDSHQLSHHLFTYDL